MTATKLFRIDKSKLLGRNIDSFLSQEESEHCQSHNLKILQHNNKQSCKLVIQRVVWLFFLCSFGLSER
jgi:hypothetical protein